VNLKVIKLNGCLISDFGLQYLSELTRLREIELNNVSKITNNGLSCLSLLTNLTKLDLSWSNIDDDGLRYISRFYLLKKLTLYHCDKITNNGLIHLKDMNYLKSLNLKDCKKIRSLRESPIKMKEGLIFYL